MMDTAAILQMANIELEVVIHPKTEIYIYIYPLDGVRLYSLWTLVNSLWMIVAQYSQETDDVFIQLPGTDISASIILRNRWS